MSVKERDTATLVAGMEEFLTDEVLPAESEFEEWRANHAGPDEWPGLQRLRDEARQRGLWNLYLKSGLGLSHTSYAPVAELSGHSPDLAPAAINGGAPNSVNMVMLEEAGSPEQQERWLTPLLDGTASSAFAMTEPDVASSDASNVATRIELDGDRATVNGHKWYVSGAADPRCEVLFVMGVSHPDGPKHARHSIVAIPRDTPGVEVVRTLPLYGFNSDPAEVVFNNVEVPIGNLIGPPGEGFRTAQTRLAAARLQHAMRLVGMCERALTWAVQRASERTAFGGPLSEKGLLRAQIAECRLATDQARLATMHAARTVDQFDGRTAQAQIAQAKVLSTRAAVSVIDRAIAIHGARGLSGDTPLARWFALARGLHIADGPEEVHLELIARAELRSHSTGKDTGPIRHGSRPR